MDTCTDVKSSESRWFAVRALPQREHIALLHLHRQGFGAFLPRVEKTSRRGPHIHSRASPFFPGYLFVSLALTRDRWRSVNGTLGVQRLVSFGDRPAPAPRGMVEEMIRRTTENGVLQLNEEFEAGDRVRLVGGPFDGLVGIFMSAADGDRVSILLGMLAREVAVTAPRAGVTAA